MMVRWPAVKVRQFSGEVWRFFSNVHAKFGGHSAKSDTVW